MDCSYHSSYLTSPDLISTDVISSEQSASWLVAATENWVVRCVATQFAAVAATNRSALSSDEMRSVDMKSDEVRWDDWYMNIQ